MQRGIVPPRTGEAHDFVWDRFRNARRQCRQIWALGDRLRRRRRLADYEDSFPNLEKEVNHSLSEAEDFFTELQGIGRSCP